jgi:hypothetical protein
MGPFEHQNLYVDSNVRIEMKRLKLITTWIPFILQLKTYIIPM